MAEYFGYVDHAVDSQVNWAEIGKSITGMIDAEQQRRAEKKDQLDKMTQQLADDLAKAPTGVNQNANQFIASLVHDSTEYNLILNRGLKSGKIKPKDFMLMTQNQSRNVSDMFDLTKQIQDYSKTTQEGIDNGTYLPTDQWKLTELNKYIDLKNTKAVINPYDGSISLGVFNDKTKKYDGLMSVDLLKGMYNTNTRAYDIDGEIKKRADSLGKIQLKEILQQAAQLKPGIIIDVENAQFVDEKIFDDPALAPLKDKYTVLRDNYIKAEEKSVDALMYGPNSQMTVLLTKLNKYGWDSLTKDEKEAAADPEKILVKVGSNGDVSLDENAPHYKEQKEEVRDYIRTTLRSQQDMAIKKDTSLTSITPPKPASKSKSKDAGSKTQYPTWMDPWYILARSNNPNEIQAAISSLKGYSKLPSGNEFIDIVPKGNGIYNLYFKDNSKNVAGVNLRAMPDIDLLQYGRLADPNMGQDKIDLFFNKSNTYSKLGGVPVQKTQKSTGTGTAAGQQTIVNVFNDYTSDADKFIKEYSSNSSLTQNDIKFEKVRSTVLGVPTPFYDQTKVILTRKQSDGTTLKSKPINVRTQQESKIKANIDNINSFVSQFK